MTTRLSIVLLSGLVLGMAVGLGCRYSELDSTHCANNDGDAYCAAWFSDGSRPFCERGTAECVGDDAERGCVAVRPPDACYSPCGGRSSAIEQDACVVEASSGSSGASTGSVEPGSSSSGDSSSDPDPGSSTTGPPACDGDEIPCEPCTAHEHCPSGACELAVERCFPAGVVTYVDGDDDPDPLVLAQAVSAVPDGGYGVIVLHQLQGGAPYQVPGGLRIDGGKTLALLAATGEQPRLRGTGGAPALRVLDADTAVYVDGLHLVDTPLSRGVLVDGALAWLDRSQVVRNGGGGVLARDDAALTLRNCFVGGMGTGPGVEVIAASATLLYSTVVTRTLASTPALACSMPVEVDVRNSILLTDGGTSPDELQCPGATVVDSATEVEVGTFDDGWFADHLDGTLWLTPWGAYTFSDVAVWRAGDPPTDIQGDPRPTVAGTPDHAGADSP